MPVYRFRSVEAMNQPVWRTPGDPLLYRVIAGLWRAGSRIQRRRFPAGVHRYRSIHELDARVDEWHRAHVDGRR